MKGWKISLAMQMLIATCLGLAFGLIFGDACDAFAPYASAYIMLLKVTAVPYLIGAIIHGVGQLGASQAKMILKKGLLFILLAWVINICMIYTTYLSFPVSTTNGASGYVGSEGSPLNFAELLIPENIFYDLSNNIVPSIVIFSLLIGMALMQIKEKQILIQGFQILVDCLTKITGWIARITPIGTFLIIAHQSGTIEFSTVKQISSYLILYILCLCLIVFWIFPRITSMLTSIPTYRWLQQMFPVLLLAYTTNIVIICLPYIIELLRKETISIDPYDEKAQNQIQGTVSVLYNLPMGSWFITLFIFFVSLFYNIPLSLANQTNLFVTSFLTSLGAMGIGSWINSLTFILDSLGLPQESLSLFLSTVPFTAGFQAMTSAMEITSISLLIILASRKLLRIRVSHCAKSLMLTFLPVVCLFLIIKSSHLLPEIQNAKKSIFSLSITSQYPVTTHTIAPSPEPYTGDVFDKILQTKTLRIGYCPHVAPFSFYNSQKQIVGYDIAFAYELAYDLGCSLEFVPLTYSQIAEELNQGIYDIAMSAISLTEQRLKTMEFSPPYLQPAFVFLVPEEQKELFSSIEKIRKQTQWTIGVLKGTSYPEIARSLFPKHKIVLLNSPDDLLSTPAVDALFWVDAEAMAWASTHRTFRIARPLIGQDSFAYAIRPGSPRLREYLYQWLSLKQVEGYTQKQHNLWILEKTEMVTPSAPRWSLARYWGWAD